MRQGALALIIGVLLGVLAMLLLVRFRMAGADVSPESTPQQLSPPTASPTPAQTPPSAAPSSQTPVSPAPDRSAAVGEIFRRFAGEHPGRWNLCFVALPDGEPVVWGGEEGPVVSASLIKLPIMGAVYERLERGEMDRESAERWLGPMITVSDNSCANSLVRMLGDGDDAAGIAAVNDWCQRQGLTDTRQNRLMLVDDGSQNYTSAADCARLLTAIYRGECVSPEASRQMLSLLQQQQVNDRLPLGLPEGTPIAHKTGDLIGLCWADVGIIYSPGGDYILCVISDGQADEREAKSASAELSREVYELMNP